MSPPKQIPLEKHQIMIFKVVSYYSIAMLIRTIGNGIGKCDSNLNFVLIIICVYFLRVMAQAWWMWNHETNISLNVLGVSFISSSYAYIYISCLKKRRLYTTKASCYLQSSCIYYLYYVIKITKIYVKIKSSNIHQIMKSKT